MTKANKKTCIVLLVEIYKFVDLSPHIDSVDHEVFDALELGVFQDCIQLSVERIDGQFFNLVIGDLLKPKSC